jgi:hypothetical protein
MHFAQIFFQEFHAPGMQDNTLSQQVRDNREGHTQHDTFYQEPLHLNPEDGGSMYCRNVHRTKLHKTSTTDTAVKAFRPPLRSSGQSFWLVNQGSRVRFPALPDFLSSSGTRTGSTQPREDKWGSTWEKSSGSGPENRLTTVGDPQRWPRDAPLSTKVGTKFLRQVAVAESV